MTIEDYIRNNDESGFKVNIVQFDAWEEEHVNSAELACIFLSSDELPFTMVNVKSHL